jgi:hypothetical protein
LNVQTDWRKHILQREEKLRIKFKIEKKCLLTSDIDIEEKIILSFFLCILIFENKIEQKKKKGHMPISQSMVGGILLSISDS